MRNRGCPSSGKGVKPAAGARELHVLDLLDGPCPAVGVGLAAPGRCMGAWCKVGGCAGSVWLRNGRACRTHSLLVSWEVPPAGAALEQLDQFTPEHLSRLLWAYSTLRIYSPELYSAVSSVAALLQTGKPRLFRPGSVLRQLVGIELGTCARTWRCHPPYLGLTAYGARRCQCQIAQGRQVPHVSCSMSGKKSHLQCCTAC